MTQLTKLQEKTFVKEVNNSWFTVTVRFDDRCNNGHNTLSITGEYRNTYGCLHEDIAKYFPELAYLIPWHLTSTDGPMHYIANTMYHAECRKLQFARESAIWPDATYEQLEDRIGLMMRLPDLMRIFRGVVESMGFTY